MQQMVSSRVRTNSWLIAMILCINTFSKILGIFITIPFNIVIMETALLIFLAVLNENKILMKKELIIILVIVAGIMVYSLIVWNFDSRVIERLLKFVMYAFFSMLCIQYTFDEQTLLKAICVIGLLHATYLFVYAEPRLKVGIISMDDTMDLSYTSLIYLFASVSIVANKQEKNVLRICALTSCVAFVYFLTLVSTNRGALVAAGCYFAFRFVSRCKQQSLRTCLFFLVVMLAVIAYLNIVPILESIDEFTTACGIEITPLKKTIWQMNNTDSMTSGREDNYAIAIQMIKDTWALPNGVASYHIQTMVAYYPHNIFLEAGVEFGFIGFVLVALVIVKACYMMVISPRKYSHLILLLFCLSIPRLMVSSSYWENSYIWPMLMLMWSKEQRKACCS